MDSKRRRFWRRTAAALLALAASAASDFWVSRQDADETAQQDPFDFHHASVLGLRHALLSANEVFPHQ